MPVVSVGRRSDGAICVINQTTTQGVWMSRSTAEAVANHIASVVVGLRGPENETVGPFTLKRDEDTIVFSRAGLGTVFVILPIQSALLLSQRIRQSIALQVRKEQQNGGPPVRGVPVGMA